MRSCTISFFALPLVSLKSDFLGTGYRELYHQFIVKQQLKSFFLLLVTPTVQLIHLLQQQAKLFLRSRIKGQCCFILIDKVQGIPPCSPHCITTIFVFFTLFIRLPVIIGLCIGCGIALTQKRAQYLPTLKREEC